MRSGPTFSVKVVLCLFICGCFGAPPKEVGQTSKLRAKYTDQEDMFIVERLPILLDIYQQGKSNNFWSELSKKLNEKYAAGTPGFPQERTANSLSSRFDEHLIHNYSRAKVKVPESLKEQLRHAKSARPEKGCERKDNYSPAETAFIIDEVLQPSFTQCFSEVGWKRIKAKHDKKRLSNSFGFENERSFKGMREHLLRLKKKDQLPTAVRNKLHKMSRGVSGAGTSKPKVRNRELNMKDAQGELNDTQIADMIAELENTDFEIDVNKLDSLVVKNSPPLELSDLQFDME